MFYVYLVTNLVNNKVYIGKSFNIHKRWCRHINTAKNKPKASFSYIHKAINKYGQNNFRVEEIYRNTDEQLCLEKEIEYIARYKSNNSKFGYNLTAGGDGVSGYQYTPEQKAAISKRMKDTRCGNKNTFYGKSHSNATKQLISDARKSSYHKHKDKYTGENASQSKLTKSKVIEIKNLYLNSSLTQKEIGNKFNVTSGCIDSIIIGRTWEKVGPKIDLSKQEKIAKYYDKILGPMTCFSYNCKECEVQFKIERRLHAKKKGAYKFCGVTCRMRALIKNNQSQSSSSS